MPRQPINPDWPHFDRLTFAPATRVALEGRPENGGNLLFISGLTATDDDGNLVGPGDIAAQARRIYQLMGQILAEAGASFADVVKTVDYITTTDGYRDTAQVRRDVFGPDAPDTDPAAGYPAATGVIVAGLLRPGALIEIDAVAVIPATVPEPVP